MHTTRTFLATLFTFSIALGGCPKSAPSKTGAKQTLPTLDKSKVYKMVIPVALTPQTESIFSDFKVGSDRADVPLSGELFERPKSLEIQDYGSDTSSPLKAYLTSLAAGRDGNMKGVLATWMPDERAKLEEAAKAKPEAVENDRRRIAELESIVLAGWVQLDDAVVLLLELDGARMPIALQEKNGQWFQTLSLQRDPRFLAVALKIQDMPSKVRTTVRKKAK